jgi:hypothetical protein
MFSAPADQRKHTFSPSQSPRSLRLSILQSWSRTLFRPCPSRRGNPLRLCLAYPAGRGSNSVWRNIAPKSRRVRWLSASARVLLVKYGATEGLQRLDALQLAVALDLQHAGQITALVTADQRLCRAAMLAGCPAVSPEKPGPIVV